MFERMREDIQSVFHRDPAARNAFEVLTCYPGCTPSGSIDFPIGCGRMSGNGWRACRRISGVG